MSASYVPSQRTWLLLLIAAAATGSEVPVSTLAQVARGGVVISSPTKHAGSHLVRVDVASDKTAPGICKGAEFCCTPVRDGRSWYLLDGDSSGPAHDAWFTPLSRAAGLQAAVRVAAG